VHPAIAELPSAVGTLGLHVDRDRLLLFDRYLRAILAWQGRINLLGTSDPNQIVVLHFVDSLAALAVCDFPVGSSVVDVGSGAGLPGIPLKIIRPDLKVTLVESSRRRAGFLEHVRSVLGLIGMDVLWARAEELGASPKGRETFDRSVERAAARFRPAAEMCLPLIKVGGASVFLKGPGVEEELVRAGELIDALGGRIVRSEVHSLPVMGRRRAAIVIHKVRSTPAKFPRRPPNIGTQP
jgi:16S rRNA (guanine527-N7)-methyltransferase